MKEDNVLLYSLKSDSLQINIKKIQINVSNIYFKYCVILDTFYILK